MNVNLRSKRDFFFSRRKLYHKKMVMKKCNGEQNGITYILDRMDVFNMINNNTNLATSKFPFDFTDACKKNVMMSIWHYSHLMNYVDVAADDHILFSRLNIINESLHLFTMIWHQVTLWADSRKLLFHIWVDQSGYKVCRLVRFLYVLLVKIITSILCNKLEFVDLENENSNNLSSGHDNDST